MPLTRIRQTAIGEDSITSAKLAHDLDFDGQFVRIPHGTTAERPATAYNGYLRYNTTFERLEQYADGLWQSIDTPPAITSLAYPSPVTKADPAGGETITLTGSNFQSGATVTVGGTSSPTVTYVSSTSITFVTPAKTVGDYDVRVTNPNGLSANLTNGISYNGTPSFTTAADLGDFNGNVSISSLTIVAAEADGGTVSYSISTPASPDFVSINSSTGALSGTTPAAGGSDTNYSFVVTATDDENQTNTRTYTLTVLGLFYAHQIPTSLSFTKERSQRLHLDKSGGTDGNRQTWTISMWVKRSTLSSDQALFSHGGNSSGEGFLKFNSNDTLQMLNDGHSGAANTTMRFTDTTGWYHIVWAVDTTAANNNDRWRLWVNGGLVDASNYGSPTITSNGQGYIQYYSGAMDVAIGERERAYQQAANAFYPFDGKIAEVHFIDGQQLGASTFGEFTGGIWKPKQVTGVTYGTNGYYLPLRNESIEGWSVTQHMGTAEVQAIDGVGFSPDLAWFKWRSGNSGWEIHDTVRHLGFNQGRRLRFDLSDAESTVQNGVYDIVDDGYLLAGDGGGGESNGANRDYVVYNWDAGTGQVQNSKLTVTGTVGSVQYEGETQVFTAAVTGTYDISYFGGGDNANSSGSTGIGQTGTLFNWGTHELFVNGVSQLTWQGAYLSNSGGSQSYTRQRAAQNGSTTLSLTAGDVVKVVFAGSNADLFSGTYYNTYQGSPTVNFTSPNNITDGTINAQVKANDSYGFSIVGYTGTGANATVGHGLSAAPEWIIIKNRSTTDSWAVYHTSAGASYSLAVDTNAAKTSGAAMFNATAPDANVFNVGSNARTNGSGNSMIAYCWRPITGYSKFGTYSGSGSAGNAITGLGFAPALIIIKRSDTTGNWVVFDHLRSPVSRVDDAMSLDISDRTYTSADGVGGIDWGTDGFTLQDNHSTRNASGGTYLYMAFADTSSYQIWKDYSSNASNHFELKNTGQYRVSNDSPTGEY